MKFPLLAPAPAGSPLFWIGGEPVTRTQFLADVAALAPAIPAGVPLLNLCESRYAFALALGACLLRRSACVLPPSGGAEVVRQVARASGATAVLAEREALAAGLPFVAVPERPWATAAGGNPQIDGVQIAAIAYTSGSTGTPQPHPKTWGSLVRTAHLASERFFAGLGAANIAGTVPAQHMYGLETTVIMALAGAHSSAAARPFFPADVAAVLAQLPAPRVLITTPVHLRALVADATRLPELARIISATAPLPAALARDAETALGAAVHEIYGCTEGGSMASRRTVGGDAWTLYPGMRVEATVDGAVIRAEHLPHVVEVSDHLESDDGIAFRLLGRSADTLKVAGKRISLAELTACLLSIPGVRDGVVFEPEGAGVMQRPAALVVAPALSEAQVLDALARLVDPVFLPRPLRKVDALPRNAVGKLPRACLQELLDRG